MKRIISACLIAGIVSASFPAMAFSDVSNPDISRAADALSSLGIMQGVGGNTFSPNGKLTRAQFCKLAVLTLGTNDISSYKNYTIFPDVPNTHWAAGYINTAVKKHAIIKGFPDGTFQPDRALSYGEACTMFLFMLGYTTDDIGPLWPSDYISKAESLGITKGVTIVSATETVSRGSAAIMLRNILEISKKGGDMLLKSAFPNIVQDSILLATSETDSDLSSGQARFFESADSIERYTMNTIGQSLIGAKGYVVFDVNQKNKVKGFLPESQAAQTFVVKKSYADKLETTTGTLKPTSSTPVILNGKKVDYSKAWVDFVPDQKINVYYDTNGKIDIMAVASSHSASSTFIFAASGSSMIPNGYSIVKSGSPASVSDIKPYDVVSLDEADRKATVTDKKITGYLSSASPSYSYPSSVTVLGKEYKIPENVKGFFRDMKYNDQITLLFDSYGNIAAAYPSSVVKADMLGVIAGLDDKKATVTLVNGITISTTLENSEENVATLVNQMVKVTQYNNGNMYLSKSSFPLKTNGDWDINKGTLGKSTVLPRVTVYEQVDDDAPLNEIEIKDIDLSVIPADHIKNTLTDGSGKVRAIVIDDITGDSYDYGIASNYVVKDDSERDLDDSKIINYYYHVKLKSSDNSEKTYKVFRSYDIEISPVGIPKGMDRFKGRIILPIKKLTKIDTVSLEKFDGEKGVRTSDGYYPMSDDIKVYAKDYDKFISLSEAKANFKRFRVYADKSLANGGKIRLIYAESLKPDTDY